MSILNWTIFICLLVCVIILMANVYAKIKNKEENGGFIFAHAMLSILLVDLLINSTITSTEQNVVYLKKLPNELEYFHYTNNDDKKTIEYLDGVEMVTLPVDEYKLYYDSDNEPYMEIEKDKNLFGESVQTKVAVHLEKIEIQD